VSANFLEWLRPCDVATVSNSPKSSVTNKVIRDRRKSERAGGGTPNLRDIGMVVFPLAGASRVSGIVISIGFRCGHLRLIIALRSHDGVVETGLLGCPPEKRAAKLATSN
jgi:hypothetical protein